MFRKVDEFSENFFNKPWNSSYIITVEPPAFGGDLFRFPGRSFLIFYEPAPFSSEPFSIKRGDQISKPKSSQASRKKIGLVSRKRAEIFDRLRRMISTNKKFA